MQHTLVPPKARKLLRQEYHVRAWIVAFFAVSVAGTVGVASLFPAFMRGSLEERLELDTIATLEKQKNEKGLNKIEAELSSDKVLLAALLDGLERKTLSSEIEKVISEKGNIKITSISVNNAPEGKTQVILQGVAPTREALLSFKIRLENQVPGTETTLPISQLAKSTNIQFSLEIIRPKI